ncbi:importin-4 [Garra rufa]|uniref:importin-4 n=1 Tax=Garra rufa TaxID=137080 RepID=UPI003CCEF5D3
MSEELERILARLTEPDNAVIQQATAELKQAFKDPAIIPALCAVMTGSQNPQVRQSAAVMLRMRVRKHWKKISPDHRESLKAVVLQALQQETEHTVRHALSQLSAVLVKHETPDRWPALLALLNQSTKSNNPQDRQVGLLLLSKVVGSNPEPFKPHYKQLLQLFGTVLQDLNNPTALYYCILTLTAITAYTGTEEMNLMRSLIPKLLVALKHLIQADQDQASEAMEVFDELMESEVSIVVPHIAEIVRFCLEISADVSLSNAIRVKALSCIAVLIRLKSKAVLKHKLLQPILQVVFPILSAAPPPGEEDPEDAENDTEDDSENPKHFAVQVIDTMALHMPPEKLFHQLMPFTQACLSSENPYERKGGLMCVAVLAEGCADHIRTKMLSSMLQTVCRSLSDNNQVVRSAALFALGQFSEHLQLLSLRSTEGVTAHLGEDKQFVLLDDDDADEEGEEGDAILDEEGETEVDDRDVAGFSVENAYIDEKEDACDALGEIAFNTGVAFQPFLESSFQQVYELRDFPHEDVRRAAFGAMGHFCRAQHKVWKENPTEANHQALHKLLQVVLPCFLEAVRQDRERQVVMAILESMNAVIKSCQGEALQAPGILAEISNTIKDVLKKKTVCQDVGGDEADDDEQQAEFDAMLQEFAGEGIPVLASAVPAETFYPHLNDLLPLIISKAKSSCTEADRSFSIGTIGETLHSLAGVTGGRAVAGRLSNRLLPVLVAGVRDSDAEVRNNSVFALGVLAQAAGPIIASDFPMMLSLFSNLLSKESDLRVIDNLCAALCRMIMNHVEGVPLEQVFPALVACLPLKEDMEENKTIYSCLTFLYSHNPVLVVSHLKPIISAAAHLLGMKDVDNETQNALLMLLRGLAQHHTQEFQSAVMSLPDEQRNKMTMAVTQS